MAASPSAHDGHDAAEKLQVNANRLWTGGVATAVVAALVAVVGVLIARGLLDVPVLAPTEEGVLGNANTARLALVAAGAALAATGLMHLLLLFIPRPWQFFTWIMSLVTLAAVLAPFSTDAEIATKVATAAIFLAIGVAIGSLVSGVASSAVRLGGEEQSPAG
ncbi:MAG TPA: DUF6069 family protein [Actinomycetes bacterium]|nr:DUF6069 family protein [Actinomycetes bacterium]